MEAVGVELRGGDERGGWQQEETQGVRVERDGAAAWRAIGGR